jgi:hypothetical protein
MPLTPLQNAYSNGQVMLGDGRRGISHSGWEGGLSWLTCLLGQMAAWAWELGSRERAKGGWRKGADAWQRLL